MAVVINGSGTFSGISSGGIDDANCIDPLSLPSSSIIQTQSTNYTTQATATTGWVNAAYSTTFTPKSSSSKVLIMVSGAFGHTTDTYGGTKLVRYNGSTYTEIGTNPTNSGGSNDSNYFLPINRRDGDAPWEAYNCSGFYVDSPAQTNGLVYYWQFRVHYGSTISINRPTNTYNYPYHWNSTSHITLMEIAG